MLAVPAGTIQLQLLGRIRINTEQGALLHRVMAGDHRTALLAYLALALPASRRRESVIALFWSDQQSNQARHSLRQLLHVLRGELGDGVIIKTGDEFVGVDGSRLWCDAVAFGRALADGQLERALDLYSGPFCDGLTLPSAPEFDGWLERMRVELHEQAADAARVLAYQNESWGRLEEAVHWGRRALRLVPYDEGMLRWLIRVSETVGGAAAALRVYADYEGLVRTYYDIAPSKETVDMIRSVRARHDGGAPVRLPPRGRRPQ